MNWEHPELQEMLCLGCSNPMDVMLAFQSYMHLCEVEKLHNVNYFYNSELDLIYLSSSVKGKLVFHVPIPAQFRISPAWMHNVNTVLLKENPLAEVNILLRTPDSTVLPYKLTEGLCPPPTPEATKEKKALQEKIQIVQSELHKRKREFYEEAKRKRIQSSDGCIKDKCDDKRKGVDVTANHKTTSVDVTVSNKREKTFNDKVASVDETVDNKVASVDVTLDDKTTCVNKTEDDMTPNIDVTFDDNRANSFGDKAASVNGTLDGKSLSRTTTCEDKKSIDSETSDDKKLKDSETSDYKKLKGSETSDDKKSIDNETSDNKKLKGSETSDDKKSKGSNTSDIRNQKIVK